MTLKRTLILAPALASGLALLALLATPTAQAQGNPRGTSISGTIFATLDWNHIGPNGPEWIGYAVVTFGKGPPLTAQLVDHGNWFVPKRNGGEYGSETITLEFPNTPESPNGAGSFKLEGLFQVNPGSTPAMFYLHETAKVEGGEGYYKNVSGQVTIQGPAVAPDLKPLPETELLPVWGWIAEIHGVVFGLK